MKIDPEGPVTDYINTMLGYIGMNLLFVLFCIPVITIGPALTALYEVVMKDAAKEYGYHVKTFVRAFGREWKRSMKIWLLLGIPAAAALFGCVFYFSLGTSMGMLVGAVLFLVLFYLAGTVTFVFPYASRFEGSVTDCIRNAHRIGIAHFGSEFVFVLTDAAILYGMYSFRMVRGIMILFGFAFLALCKAYRFRKIFAEYEGEKTSHG